MKDWKSIAEKADKQAKAKSDAEAERKQREMAIAARSRLVLEAVWSATVGIVEEVNPQTEASGLKLSISDISNESFMVSKSDPSYFMRIGTQGQQLHVRIAKELDLSPGMNSYQILQAGELAIQDGLRIIGPSDFADDFCERFIRVGAGY